MLQQTQVKTVIPYFNRFVKEVPNLKSLSNTGEKKVLKLWEGLGYYRRAKNLRKSAKILRKVYKNKIPDSFDKIKKLPGVGDYTANILLALIYNQPRIGVDGNVKRVYERLCRKKAKENNLVNNFFFNKSTLNNRNADFAEALMEFGAIICKPKNPNCNTCNLKNYCKFFKNKNLVLEKEKHIKKEKKYNVFCYLKKKGKKIALKRNKNVSFLKNFYLPEIQNSIFKDAKIKKNRWIYLSSFTNNISNIKMSINLFYKFTNVKPKNFKWHSIGREKSDFIPSFTKKIFLKISKICI